MSLLILLLALYIAIAALQESPNAELIRGVMQTPAYASKSSITNDVYEDAKLDVPALIQKYGYPCEIHTVITPDGYILEMHRIPHGRDKNNVHDPIKIPVLMMHGLLSSSADFVANGPENSLGYLLAELGYDVWMGNARGTYYSRKHVYLDPDAKSQKFWRFSLEHIGNIDTPAFIDRIMAVTKHSKMHYVGHSQGGTSLLVLGSLRPEYNDKLISFHGLAPASFFIYNDYKPIRILALPGNLAEKIAFKIGIAEIFPRSDFWSWIGANICSDDSKLQPLCLNFPIIGRYLKPINTTKIPTYLGHTPAGASLRQAVHYGQMINNGGNFTRFDYGLFGNLARYRKLKPPNYDLQKITVPMYIYYSVGDLLVNPRDILVLASSLPNLKGLIKVARADFTHVDFIWAPDVTLQVYNDVFRMMRQAELENKLVKFKVEQKMT